MKKSRVASGLGLERDITRRDFVKGALVGSGAMLLDLPAPGIGQPAMSLGGSTEASDWNGYSGVGDYARSNGNTYAVREAAHLIRDNKIDALLATAVDLGESFDVVVAGGGFSGVSAGRTFVKEAKKGQSCLLLENHPLTGGEAKRNEFFVDGYRLVGPQGSNLVSVPSATGDWYDTLWSELGIPRTPSFQELTGPAGNIRIPRENFTPMFGVGDQVSSSGYFFDSKTFGGHSRWDVDSHKTRFLSTAFPAVVKRDLQRLLIDGAGRNLGGEQWERWLDSMTFSDYLVKVLGIQPETTRLLDPTLCVEGGLGADCVSALFALKVGQPGFDRGFPADASLYRVKGARPEDLPLYSFPGGNDAVFRLLLKKTLPEAISGGSRFEDIHDGVYQFEKFDRPAAPMRIRLNSTVVHVVHDGPADHPTGVIITYRNDGKLFRVRAKAFVSCIGGWVNKHIVRDLPKQYDEAFGRLNYGSAMIVNIALTNWRFLAKLGISAAHSFMNSGLGQTMNIRRPMMFGSHPAPLNPDKPIVLTLYVGFSSPGLPARAQAAKARWELLAKSYRDYEILIRQHLSELFASAGFDAKRDIAGIVLNRWGHSYVVPEPGFYYGSPGRPSPRDVLSKRTGRIAFGHSELNGVQEWFGGVENGERAMRQALEVL